VEILYANSKRLLMCLLDLKTFMDAKFHWPFNGVSTNGITVQSIPYKQVL